MKACPCKWSQTRDAVVLTFTCKDSDNRGLAGEPTKAVADDWISFAWGELKFSSKFLHPIRGASAKWDIHNGVATVILRKGVGHATRWAHPFETKIATVKVNWDRWEEDEWDDSEMGGPIQVPGQLPPEPAHEVTPQDVDKLKAMAAAVQTLPQPVGALPPPPPPPGSKAADGASDGAKAEGEDANGPPGSDRWLELPHALEAPAVPDEADGAPAEGETPSRGCAPANAATHAIDGEMGASSSMAASAPRAPPAAGAPAAAAAEPAWVEDWCGLTMPQRMVTMAECWNSQEVPVRQACALKLIELLRSGDAQLAQLEAAIKGGHLGQLRLDTSVYASEMRPQRWITAFRTMSAAQQMGVLAVMFRALSYDEQKLVVATFA